MKKNHLLIGILVLLIAGGSCACKMPFGKKKAVATGDNFEPNTICSLLNDMKFDTEEYKEFSGGSYFCTGTSPGKVFYNVTGDKVGAQQIEIVVLPEAKPEDAEKNAETVARAAAIVWQKIVSKPLPDEIKEQVLAGKKEKMFDLPIRLTVVHDPHLSVTITMPSEEWIKRLKAEAKNAEPSAKPTPYTVTSGIKAPEPCGYLQNSLGLIADSYGQSSDHYECFQKKALPDSNNFTYQAFGNETTINLLILKVYMSPKNTDEQKRSLSSMLTQAANDTAQAASGQKLSAEMIAAIVFGETKDFTFEPGADATKTPIKRARVIATTIEGSGIMTKEIWLQY